MKSNTVRLGGIADICSGGTPSKKRDEYWKGCIPWVSAKSMDADWLNTNLLFISEEGLKAGSKLAPSNSILLLTRGSGLFNRIPVIWIVEPLAFNQDIKCITAKNPLDARFIYHWLCSQREHLSKMLDVTGIGAGKINTDQLLSLEVFWPEYSVRRKIVTVADSIVEKMTLNQLLNDYLRELIKVLFAHWFKDFAPFQSEDTYVTEIGDIPTSVKLVPLAELTKVITKGTTPTTLGFEYKKSGINFIKGENIGDDHSFDYGKFAHIDEEANAALKRSVIEDRDLLFTIAGTLGRFAMAEKEMIPANTNQAVGIIRADERLLTPEVLLSYFIGGWQEDYYARRVQQAVQANLSLSTLKSLPVPILEGNRRSEYEEQIVPIIHAIEANSKENRRLSELRDILLPKLMSGEIDVSKIDLTQLNNHLA